jgi:hypothetical protein
MKPKKMRVDSSKILEKLATEEDRERVSLYLSKHVYEDFKKACQNAPVSRVVEELMKEFIKSTKSE